MEVSLMTSITMFLIGAGCFAIGYLLAANNGNTNAIPPEAFAANSLRYRFLRWAKSIVRGRSVRPMAPQDCPDNTKMNKTALFEIESLAEILEDFKMVLVVRNDLKMGKGKIAAQCSHATLGLYKKLFHRAPNALNRWELCGQVKVVLKIESEEDLLILQQRAKSLKLPTHITIDAGRTQIAPNSRTVMAILDRGGGGDEGYTSTTHQERNRDQTYDPLGDYRYSGRIDSHDVRPNDCLSGG